MCTLQLGEPKCVRTSFYRVVVIFLIAQPPQNILIYTICTVLIKYKMFLCVKILLFSIHLYIYIDNKAPAIRVVISRLVITEIGNYFAV